MADESHAIDFFARSREYWERRYGRSLTNEEVRQIIANSSAFFEVLIQWDAQTKAEKAAKPPSEATS